MEGLEVAPANLNYESLSKQWSTSSGYLIFMVIKG